MGWEKRERGGSYYIRKVRQGNTVHSTYIGNGETAEMVAQRDRFRRAQQELRRLAEQEAQAEWIAIEKQVTAYCAEVETVLRQSLKAAGYRQHHRGAWRRQRGNRSEQA